MTFYDWLRIITAVLFLVSAVLNFVAMKAMKRARRNYEQAAANYNEALKPARIIRTGERQR